jgi:hypothetical protein
MAVAICFAIGRVIDRHRPLRDAIGERGPLDAFHDQRRHARRFLEAVDRGDVGVVQRRDDFRFSLEARQPFNVERHRQWRTLMATERFRFVSVAR